MNLVTRDRILVHLFLYSRYENDFEVPYAVAQEGIAEAVYAPRAHVSAVLKEMRAAGLIYSKLAHVSRGFRRKNVYFLTDNGKERAKPLVEQIRIEMPGECEDIESLMQKIAGKTTEAGERRGIELFGREEEKRKVREFLESKDGKFFVIYGLPGIGKTHFLLHLAELHSLPYLDFPHRVNSPAEFYIALANGLARKGRFRLKKYLQRNGYAPEARWLAVEEMKGFRMCIDNIQNLTEVQEEFRNFFGVNVKVIAGAREKPGFYTERDVVSGDVLEIQLQPLARDAGDLLLAREGIAEPGLRSEIYEKAGGHPLMMLMLARGGTVANWRYLFDEVFSRLSDGERHALKILALGGEVPGLWKELGIGEVMGLERKGLVYWIEDSCYVHPMLREFVIEAMGVQEKQAVGLELWKLLGRHRGYTALKAGMRVLLETGNSEELARYLEENFNEVAGSVETAFLETLFEKLRTLEKGEIGCMRAEIALRKGEWEKAIAILSGLPEKLQRFWEMERTYILARAHNMGTDHAGAVKIAEKGYRRFRHPKFLLVKGRALAAMGEFERAMDVLLDALAAGAEQGITLAELGNLLMDKGNHEGAINYFERAIEFTADGALRNKMRINLAISEFN
ncbi:MAG: hypothetical protein QXJ27_06485, partial [Thermoplasmata archaeon]